MRPPGRRLRAERARDPFVLLVNQTLRMTRVYIIASIVIVSFFFKLDLKDIITIHCSDHIFIT